VTRAAGVVGGATRWPSDVAGGGVACGIKRGGRPDLGLLVARQPATWAGTFTVNAAAAPSVRWSQALLGRQVRAVVANSGNANACTGDEGVTAVEKTAAAAPAAVGCRPREVLVASTGPIGIPLAVDRIVAALPGAAGSLAREVEPFASSILTTDTSIKVASAAAGPAEVVGVAKGAAMISPSMATMLAFVVTDAALDHPALQTALGHAVDRSFNRLCIDACESTNDSVFCLATGRAGGAPENFSGALEAVCSSLAEQIARDAEGGTKLVRVNVVGARDEARGVELGRAVAGSDLWRCAVHGADPNWGRIAAALGAVDRSLDLSRLSIAIGPEVMFAKGDPVGTDEGARRHLTADEVVVTCTVGDGPSSVEILSSDISPAYVTLNAFGTT
jgi:glutamate N-acetyltransferase/amino-acid N-acetyltransferase